MYKIIEETLKEGLSPVARFLLGFVSGLFGVLTILGVSEGTPPDKAIFVYAFGIFCLLICITCITKGKVRQFVGSIIGCTLFGLSAWYSYSELTGGVFFSGSRTKPSIINSILFFVFFGIPGITYVITAKFGIANPKSNN